MKIYQVNLKNTFKILNVKIEIFLNDNKFKKQNFDYKLYVAADFQRSIKLRPSSISISNFLTNAFKILIKMD